MIVRWNEIIGETTNKFKYISVELYHPEFVLLGN